VLLKVVDTTSNGRSIGAGRTRPPYIISSCQEGREESADAAARRGFRENPGEFVTKLSRYVLARRAGFTNKRKRERRLSGLVSGVQGGKKGGKLHVVDIETGVLRDGAQAASVGGSRSQSFKESNGYEGGGSENTQPFSSGKKTPCNDEIRCMAGRPVEP